MSQDLDKLELINKIKELNQDLINRKNISLELYEKDKYSILKKIDKLEESLSLLYLEEIIEELEDEENRILVEDIYMLKILNNYFLKVTEEIDSDSINYSDKKIDELLMINHFEPIKYLLDKSMGKEVADEVINNEISHIFMSEDLLDLNEYNVK